MNHNPNHGNNRKEQRMNLITKTLSGAVLVALGLSMVVSAAESPVKPDTLPPLGHKDFYPSPQHPVGFRGDGNGCFPGATPVAMFTSVFSRAPASLCTARLDVMSWENASRELIWWTCRPRLRNSLQA